MLSNWFFFFFTVEYMHVLYTVFLKLSGKAGQLVTKPKIILPPPAATLYLKCYFLASVFPRISFLCYELCCHYIKRKKRKQSKSWANNPEKDVAFYIELKKHFIVLTVFCAPAYIISPPSNPKTDKARLTHAVSTKRGSLLSLSELSITCSQQSI